MMSGVSLEILTGPISPGDQTSASSAFTRGVSTELTLLSSPRPSPTASHWLGLWTLPVPFTVLMPVTGEPCHPWAWPPLGAAHLSFCLMSGPSQPSPLPSRMLGQPSASPAFLSLFCRPWLVFAASALFSVPSLSTPSFDIRHQGCLWVPNDSR